MALDATVGGVSANSYIDVAAADTYFASTFKASVWDSATDEDKIASLMLSTRLLDNNVNYYGDVANDAQALRWPRTGTFDKDGVEYSDTAIPQEFKNIVCDLAISLVENGGYTGSSNQFKQLNIGSLAFKYKDSGDGPFPPNVVEAIDQFGEYEGPSSGRQVSTVRLVRS